MPPRVDIVGPYGERGSVEEADLPSVVAQHWRAVTPEEQTAAKLDAEYEAKSLGDKAIQAATWGGVGPKSEAYLAAGRRMLTGGLSEAISKTARDYVDPGSGAAYAKHLDDLETLRAPTIAGSVVGLGVGVAMGGAGPFGALGEIGAPVGKAAGAVAERLGASAGGRVAATVAGGARGAFEGGILGGTEQLSHNITHDSPEVGDKLFSAIGSGILVGGGLGAALNLGSHALAQRANRAASFRAMSALDEAAAGENARMLSKGGVPEAAPEAPRWPVKLEPDAGLHEKPGFRVEPISASDERPAPGERDMQLRVGNEGAPVDTESPLDLLSHKPIAPEVSASADQEFERRHPGATEYRDYLDAKYGTPPTAQAGEASGKPGGVIPALVKGTTKLAGMVVKKGVRSLIGGAVAGLVGHTIGGPAVGMASYAAGHAATDWASRALMKAGGPGRVLDGWTSGLKRNARAVLDADAVTHLVDEAGGERAVVDSFATGAGPTTIPNPRAQAQARMSTAQAIMKWIGDIRANPTRIQGQLEDEAQAVSRAAGPKAAAAYTASTLRAIDYLAAHVPIKERRDPFDPHRLPTLNTNEVDSINRAAHYAAQPWTVYDDFGRGRIYPEGLRAAKTFCPNEFACFQAELQEQTQARVEQDPTLTQAQRLRLMKLLGYPAGATLQRTSITRLQQNMLEPPRASPVGAMGEGSAPSQGAPPAPPIRLTIDHSGFGDNIEARRASGG